MRGTRCSSERTEGKFLCAKNLLTGVRACALCVCVCVSLHACLRSLNIFSACALILLVPFRWRASLSFSILPLSLLPRSSQCLPSRSCSAAHLNLHAAPLPRTRFSLSLSVRLQMRNGGGGGRGDRRDCDEGHEGGGGRGHARCRCSRPLSPFSILITWFNLFNCRFFVWFSSLCARASSPSSIHQRLCALTCASLSSFISLVSISHARVCGCSFCTCHCSPPLAHASAQACAPSVSPPPPHLCRSIEPALIHHHCALFPPSTVPIQQHALPVSATPLSFSFRASLLPARVHAAST